MYSVPQPSLCPSITAVISARSNRTPSVGGWRFFSKTIVNGSEAPYKCGDKINSGVDTKASYSLLQSLQSTYPPEEHKLKTKKLNCDFFEFKWTSLSV